MDNYCLSRQKDFVNCKKSTQSSAEVYFNEDHSLQFPMIHVVETIFQLPLCYFDKQLFDIDSIIHPKDNMKTENKSIQVKNLPVVRLPVDNSIDNNSKCKHSENKDKVSDQKKVKIMKTVITEVKHKKKDILNTEVKHKKKDVLNTEVKHKKKDILNTEVKHKKKDILKPIQSKPKKESIEEKKKCKSSNQQMNIEIIKEKNKQQQKKQLNQHKSKMNKNISTKILEDEDSDDDYINDKEDTSDDDYSIQSVIKKKEETKTVLKKRGRKPKNVVDSQPDDIKTDINTNIIKPITSPVSSIISKEASKLTESAIHHFINSFHLNDSPDRFNNRNCEKNAFNNIKGFLNEDEILDKEYIYNQMKRYKEYQHNKDKKKIVRRKASTIQNDGIIRDKYTAMNEFDIIESNCFLHRHRYHDSDSTAFRCNCIPKSGVIPCGSDCINREMYVECNPELCNNKNKCTNCQFRKKQYQPVYFKLFPHKGWGLLAANDIEPGTFIGEYVGEVIQASDLEERIKRRNNKHVYLMALGKGEMIDATYKGGLFRYINHSCDPNCETQKWTVDGESCIGLFACKKIKRGDELTFDYCFERYTDENNVCYCGSKNCRGFIGEKRDPNLEMNPDKAIDVGLMDTTFKHMNKCVCSRVRSQIVTHINKIASIVYFRYLNKRNRNFRKSNPRYRFIRRNNLFLNRNIHNRYRFYYCIEKNDQLKKLQDIYGTIDAEFKKVYKDNIYKLI